MLCNLQKCRGKKSAEECMGYPHPGFWEEDIHDRHRKKDHQERDNIRYEESCYKPYPQIREYMSESFQERDERGSDKRNRQYDDNECHDSERQDDGPEECPLILDFKYYVDRIFKGSEDLNGKYPVEKDAPGADPFKGDEFPELLGDPGSDVREKTDKPLCKKLIEPGVMAEDVSENGYQEEAERDDRHHRKIGDRTGKHNAVVLKETQKTR